MLDSRPAVYTIAGNRHCADALAAGLISRFGAEKTGLAQGIILVPNNRAARSITNAFVRRSDGGLLLPRLVPIGDESLDLRIGGALDPIDAAEPIPPAITPLERQMVLARLVQMHLGVGAAEAVRLAKELAATLDQLIIEEVAPNRLREIASDLPELSIHWQASLERLSLILEEWPRELAARGRIDLADRRNRLLDALSRRWGATPPAGFVVAAGIDTTAPSVGRLLRRVARLPLGMVVLSALDLLMPEEEWQSLEPPEDEPDTGRRRRPVESHPQFHLKRLLDQIGVGRTEVEPWRWGGRSDAPATRLRAVSNAMAPPRFTDRWTGLPPAERRLTGVKAVELADPAEEAQLIALAVREALEEPHKTVALVTPDRSLAMRVASHLRRWNIEADDSAGVPLSQTPPGTLILGLASAAAENFAPVPLLTLLKHPLTMKGEARLGWLEGVRSLDMALRGPRPLPGLSGISLHLQDQRGRDLAVRAEAAVWWREAIPLLTPLAEAFEEGVPSLAVLLAAIRECASTLSCNQVWAGPAGRAAAELFASLEHAATAGPQSLVAADVPALLELLMNEEAVRPPFGQHPRVSIWGLLEARLQRADLMILGSVNEGSWPALPAPDPWLAPRIRQELGVPGLERRIGLSAHDFATALGAREVLITRARRDTKAPTVASRFWLRLEAMTGGIARSPLHKSWAQQIDRPETYRPAERPAPRPPIHLRPSRINVTEIDRLKADPFAFYARRLLRLGALDAVDADPSAAWRGTQVHAIFEAWMQEDGCAPGRLRPRAEALLADNAAHPLMRALWEPRLLEAVEWTAEKVAINAAEGRVPLKAEIAGKRLIEGVEVHGIADRIDRCADGSLAIVDYKTGRAPSAKAFREGFAMQLGMLGLIADGGGFPDVDGRAGSFEYWSLAREKGRLGYVASPVGGRSGIEPDEFTELAFRNFMGAVRKWLKGGEPFTAKLHPEYAPYAEYDQLMRLDEWYGRERLDPALR